MVMGAAASGALLALSPAALSGAWLAAAAGASAVALSPMAGLLARRGKTMGSGAACADGTAGGGATDQVTRPRGLVAIVARATVPHEWFVHFYVVGVVACVTAAYGVALVTDGGTAAARAAVPLALFSCHVVRRLAEEIATNSATGPRASRMHVAGYMTGLGYYAMAPATYACVAVTARDRSGAGTPSSAALCFCAGLFAYASLQHGRAHAALRAWRAARPHQYTQPSGGWFEHVCCPHYTAEVLIYSALACTCGPPSECAGAPWTLLLWVATNLAIGAAQSKAWYASKFPGYAARVAAILPGIF